MVEETKEVKRAPGRPRKFSDEERKARRKAVCRAYRHKDIEVTRVHEAEYMRGKRAERAIAEGREPGKSGHYIRPPVFSDEEKRERHRAATRKHAHANTDKARARYLANRLDAMASAKERKERFKREHPEEFAAQSSVHANNRRARLKGASGKFSAADIKWLWEQQRGCCVFCLAPLPRKGFHVDHHIPLKRGGSNDRGNLRLLHKKCNLEKSSRDPIEHAKERGMLLW
jgi:hypothetical protein